MLEPSSASNKAVPGTNRSGRAREDAHLFARYRRTGDPAARAQLTERYLPLARSLARRYERSGESLDDLIQVASLALLKAIDRFDPARPVTFSSYAVPTIVGELKRYFRDYGWSVRVPRDLQELSLRVQRESQRFAAEHGHDPTVRQLAQRLGLEVEQILEAREAVGARRAAPLERRVEDADDERPVQELSVDDPGFAAAEAAATISRLAAALPVRDREVLHLRFVEDLTQAEIAARIGCSQMHVSRTLRAAIARMQEQAGANAPPPAEWPLPGPAW
jgi:RNA polymerase sigma-B factor